MEDPSHAASGQAHHSPPDLRIAFGIALGLQVLALLVFVFGDIGFDHPGRFGLDSGHGLLLALLWFTASVAGFLFARATRRSGLLGLQWFVLCLTVGGGLLVPYWASSKAPMSPADHQEAPRSR